MFILNRSIPFVGAVLIWLLWSVCLANVKLILPFGLIISGVVFICFWQLFGRKFKPHHQQVGGGLWQFFGLPFLFIVSAFLFSILLPDNLFRHFFVFVIVFLFYLTLESVFNFLYRPNFYQTHTIETFFSHLNLLTFFFLTCGFYNLIFFFNIPFWLFLIFFFLIVMFLGFYFFWAHKILDKENVLYILIITLILAEFFWAVSFLPTNFYVNSLILTLIYYLMVILSKYHILKILNKRTIREYSIVVGIALLLALLTAQWR